MPAIAMGSTRDTAAAAEWEAMARGLRRFAGTLVGPGRAHLADDLTQDVIARLLDRAPAPPPYGYARTALLRRYLDHERGAKRRAARAAQWALARAGSLFTEPATDDNARRVREAVDALPPLQRAALVLRVVDGMEYAAIAAALGSTPESVRMSLHTARTKVRGALRDLGERSGP